MPRTIPADRSGVSAPRGPARVAANDRMVTRLEDDDSRPIVYHTCVCFPYRDVRHEVARASRLNSNCATKIAVRVIARVNTATTLIFGVSPNRSDEKISTGRVVEPGPDTNDDRTTSSNENVNERSTAAST